MLRSVLSRMRPRLRRRLGRRPGAAPGGDVGVAMRIALAVSGLVIAATAVVLALVWWSSASRQSPVAVGGSVGTAVAPTALPNTYTAPPPPTPPSAFSDHEAGDAGSFLVRAADQQTRGASVTVAAATFTGSGGWVVVHADDYGTPGPIIGVSSLRPPGMSNAVSVPLSRPVPSSAYVIVMLHREDDGNTTFDYPAHDWPQVVSGQIVEVRVWLQLG